jgi:hypothetical protein
VKQLAQRAFLRISWRLKRLGHPVPLIVPLPEASLHDLAEADGATTFTKCSSADDFERHIADNAPPAFRTGANAWSATDANRRTVSER